MPERILVLLFGDLGDTLLTVPALRALRTRYPNARITLAGKALSRRVIADLGLVDRFIEVDKHLFDRPSSLLRPGPWCALAKTVLALRRERADTLVLFHHLVTAWGALKFAGLSLASGAVRRVGLDNGRGWFLTDRLPDRGFGEVHESEYWLEVVATLGAYEHRGLEFVVNESDRTEAARLLAGVGTQRPLLVIHPGTGAYGPGRRWGPENFAQTVRSVLGQRDMTPVVVGTEDDISQAGPLIEALGDGLVNLLGRTSLGVLGAVLERAAVLVANDGGVGHLGAAVGCEVVSVFGPSNDRAWAPLGARVVSADLPCRPCFYRGFERGLPYGCATRECLNRVAPTRVAEEVLQATRETIGPV